MSEAIMICLIPHFLKSSMENEVEYTDNQRTCRAQKVQDLRSSNLAPLAKNI